MRCADRFQFIEEIPKSPTGKIQRKLMREWAKKDAEDWHLKSKL